ncbi:Fe(3+)-hydroxamate ABC transporter permease FhuB [Roseibium sp.]|uniref:Fe(3+)-hydroxamate ABC transporter permease FhuB n=1 Tax=Roseibium sp. TaxID=1936156 RepID=UPI003B52B1E1
MTATLLNRAPVLSITLIVGAALLGWPLVAIVLPSLMEAPTGYDVERMIALYSTLPRMVTALQCGAALSLSGALLQIALRNPLASPTTLGVSAGAHLALVLAGLFAPALIAFNRDIVALIGSLIAAGLVFSLVSRRDISPVTLVLGGLVVSLYCGAAATLLVLLNDRYLASLFIWGAGSLSQQDWSIPLGLFWKLAIPICAAGFLVRPLTLLSAGDEAARSLGASPARMRMITVLTAVALAAMVTSSVGVIGFIGLAAPVIARMSGARTVLSQIVWSTLIGALLLFLTDNAIQLLAGSLADFVPTGAVTALFGSPLLLLLLRKTKSLQTPSSSPAAVKRVSIPFLVTLLGCSLIPATLVFASLLFGRDASGEWEFIFSNATADLLLELRAPRVFSAAAAGSLLAAAGVILQRLSRNDMASPEVLGVSSGAMLGLAFGLFFLASPHTGPMIFCAAIGAFAIMGLILLLNRKSGFQAERMVLAGIAFTALLDALVGALAATGDLRSLQLLRWMSGTTYGATYDSATLLFGLAIALLGLALLLVRWIGVLELGPGAAGSLGLPVSRASGLLFCLAGLMTAAATLAVGPLSFIGLMAPHIARHLGFVRPADQLLVAASAGACLMVTADWIGRHGYFPYDMPSGLISALVGTPFLMVLLGRRSSR